MEKQIADLPDIVSRDEAYQNAMRYSDKQNARAEILSTSLCCVRLCLTDVLP